MRRASEGAAGHAVWRALRVAGIMCLLACGAGEPIDGLVEGGILTELEKARLHYDTDRVPPTSNSWSVVEEDPVATSEGLVYKLVTYSPTYQIDRIYLSMKGPKAKIQVPLGDPDGEPELLWVKGVHAEVVGETGEPMSEEFMCHVVARIGPLDERNQELGLAATDDRFATLSQGLYHKQYPEGFAIPVLSTHSLAFVSQVLNLNIVDPDLRVRHRIVTHYIRDRDLQIPMKAIHSTFAQVMVQLDGGEGQGYFGVRVAQPEIHGESCSVGRQVDSFVGLMNDGHRRFTAHWVIEPGEVTNHSLATQLMNIPYDTTIHAIDVHMHPFGRWIELKDLTTQQTVFRSEARQINEGIGLESVQSYRSEVGIPVFRDHQYAIISSYDNTSGVDQDAMAVMYLGIHDKEFDPEIFRDPEALIARRAAHDAATFEKRERAVRADPDDAVSRFALAASLFRGDRFAEAEEQLRIAAELDPDDTAIQQALAKTRGAMGQSSTH